MYTRVESRFWQDEKMRAMSADARYLMLYLLTSPHRNIMGFYFLPAPYACFDLGWDEERFNKELNELIKIGVIKYDHQAQVLLINNYLKHNPLENPNQVKSAIYRLEPIPQTVLLQDFLDALGQFDKPFIEPLRERLRERLGQPVTVSVTGTVSGTGEKTEGARGRAKTSAAAAVAEGIDDDDPGPDPDPAADGEVYQRFEREFGRPLSPIEAEQIDQWRDKHPDDVIQEALKRAVLRGKMGFAYISRILIEWEKAGIHTLADVAQRDPPQRPGGVGRQPGGGRTPLAFASIRKYAGGDGAGDTCRDSKTIVVSDS